MEQILELERRITAALDRLAFGIERQAALPAPQPDPAQIAQAAEALASESVAEAVALARKQTPIGGTILLSPGAPSF